MESCSGMLWYMYRFVFAVPPVTAPAVSMHVSHYPPSWANSMKHFRHSLETELIPRSRLFHRIIRETLVQFPENRLIQYDCGEFCICIVL